MWLEAGQRGGDVGKKNCPVHHDSCIIRQGRPAFRAFIIQLLVTLQVLWPGALNNEVMIMSHVTWAQRIYKLKEAKQKLWQIKMRITLFP